MKRLTALAPIARITLVLLAACGSNRTPEAYKTDVTKLMATKNDQVEACYRDALKENPSIRGDVTFRFWVNYAGKVHTEEARKFDLGIVKNKTTVPDYLANCVEKAVRNLELSPAPDKMAEVLWTWHFAPNEAPAAGPVATHP